MTNRVNSTYIKVKSSHNLFSTTVSIRFPRLSYLHPKKCLDIILIIDVLIERIFHQTCQESLRPPPTTTMVSVQEQRYLIIYARQVSPSAVLTMRCGCHGYQNHYRQTKYNYPLHCFFVKTEDLGVQDDSAKHRKLTILQYINYNNYFFM